MTEQTVNYEPRPQPFSTGDGYEAPGRAMQALGRGIASLGDAFGSFEAEANREADKRAEYEYLTAQNDFAMQEHKRLDEDLYNYPQTGGNGERFADEWANGFSERGAQWAERWKGTKYEHRAPYDVSSLRNRYAPRALNGQQSFVTQHQIGLADRNISGAVSVVTADPASLDQSIEIAESAIKAAPGLSIEHQNALRKKAADLAFETWLNKASKDLTADQIEATKKQWEERAKSYLKEAQQAPVGPGASLIPRDATPETVKAVSSVASGIGVDPAAIAAVVQVESAWNPRQSTGTYNGLTQIGEATFKEAGGKLGGLTYEQYRNATPDQQIAVYGAWLDHYKFADQMKKHGIDMAKLPVARQAAILQAFQFSPNGDGFKAALARGDDTVPATTTKQARALGSTSIRDMEAHFATLLGGGSRQQAGGVRPASPTEYLTAKLAKGYESRKNDVANLHPVMQDRLAAFMAAAEDAGHDIRVLSGHRDKARQAELWRAAVQKYGSEAEARKWVAPPGGSTHQSGEAVDLQYGDRGGGLGGSKTAAVAWAHANAKKYGLHFPLGHEDWHIEPLEAREGGKRYGGQYAKGQQMYQGGGRMAVAAPSEPVPVSQRGITAGRTPANDTGAPREANAIPGVVRVADASGQTVAPAGFSRTTQDYLMRDFETKQKKLDAVITKKREAEATHAFISGALQGTVPFNPYDKDHKKALNTIFDGTDLGEKMFAGNPEALNQGIVMVQKLNAAPDSVYQALRGLVNSKDPKKQTLGLTAINNLIDSNPNILDQHDGQAKLVERAQLYAALRGQAYEPSEALAKMAEMATPEWEKKVEFRKKDLKTFSDALSFDDIKDKAFDPGWASFEPNAEGEYRGVKDELFYEYKKIAENAFIQWGDKDVAKKFATQKIKALYGTTYTNGSKIAGDLMPLPPERFFGGPNGIDSAEIRRQMVDDVRAQLHRFAGRTEGPTPEAGLPTPVPALDESTVRLIADDTTKRNVAQTGMPTYIVQYVNKNGIPEFVLGENGRPKRWWPELSTQRMMKAQGFIDRRGPAVEAEIRKEQKEAERPAQRKQQQEELTVPSWRRDNSGQGVNKELMPPEKSIQRRGDPTVEKLEAEAKAAAEKQAEKEREALKKSMERRPESVGRRGANKIPQ